MHSSQWYWTDWQDRIHASTHLRTLHISVFPIWMLLGVAYTILLYLQPVAQHQPQTTYIFGCRCYAVYFAYTAHAAREYVDYLTHREKMPSPFFDIQGWVQKYGLSIYWDRTRDGQNFKSEVQHPWYSFQSGNHNNNPIFGHFSHWSSLFAIREYIIAFPQGNTRVCQVQT